MIARTGAARPAGRAALRAITLPQVWALVALAGIFIILNLTLVRPQDFWWHVRAGQWIVEQGRVPTTDLFTYTRLGTPFTYQMWLMEVIFYLLLQAGGLPLVIFFHAVTITAAYALLLRTSWRAAKGNLRWAALATLAAAALGINNWNVRPQTISFPLFALTLFILDRSVGQGSAAVKPAPRALWLLPPLFAFWANAHGGFVFGLALLGACLLAQLFDWLRHARRFPTQLVLVTLLSGAATLATPAGLGMAGYVLGFMRNPVTQSLNVEFQPLTVRSIDGLFFFGLCTALIVLLLASRHRLTSFEATRLLLFGGLALMASRDVAWFGFVAAPVAAACLSELGARHVQSRTPAGRARPRLNQAVLGLAGMLAVLSLPWFRPHLPLPTARQAYLSPETPVRAAQFLRNLSPAPRPFHSETDGSYLIWALPDVPVFADTRIELYPAQQWLDYLAVLQARYNWQAILDRYGVDTLLLERSSAGPLIKAAEASPTWELAYSDGQSLVFRKVRP